MVFPSSLTGYCSTDGNPPGHVLKTTNGGGIVSLQKVSQDRVLNIYPNPANDKLYISSDRIINGSSYTILDLLGRTMLSGTFTGQNSAIDISHLSDGIYLIRSEVNNDKIDRIIKHSAR